MISVPVEELRAHWEATLRRPLGHVPAAEWLAFKAQDGPFTAAAWGTMPMLYRELCKGATRE
jgi:hypothetical protein